MTVTGGQVKAARALLAWSREKLAGEAGVDTRTVANFESGDSRPYERSVHKIRRALVVAGVEFIDGEPGVRMKNDLIKLQFRNAQLRGKISRALKEADETLQREDDERAMRLATAPDDTVERLADVFENLRARALALVDAGVAKRRDFPEIG